MPLTLDPSWVLRCLEEQPLKVYEAGLAAALGFQSCSQHLPDLHLWDIPLKFLRIRHFLPEMKMKDGLFCLSSLDVIIYVKALGYV